jgi:hypothetical protein
MHADISVRLPQLVLDGILVERVAARGIEMIVGARNDPEWGVVLLVGFGGVAAEATRDVRPACPRAASGCNRRGTVPSTQCTVAARIPGRRRWMRWQSRRLWVKLGRFMLSCPWVQEVDINPVVVYPEERWRWML